MSEVVEEDDVPILLRIAHQTGMPFLTIGFWGLVISIFMCSWELATLSGIFFLVGISLLGYTLYRCVVIDAAEKIN